MCCGRIYFRERSNDEKRYNQRILVNKKKIRCYKAFAYVAPNIYNFPVYFLTYEGWSNFSFAICINCGELFVVDWENPATKGLSLNEIAFSSICPTCNNSLKDTIRDYPKTIRLPEGELKSYIPETNIPPDSESLIMEFFELIPSSS